MYWKKLISVPRPFFPYLSLPRFSTLPSHCALDTARSSSHAAH